MKGREAGTDSGFSSRDTAAGLIHPKGHSRGATSSEQAQQGFNWLFLQFFMVASNQNQDIFISWSSLKQSCSLCLSIYPRFIFMSCL
jgi:hypothetical protein